MSVAEKLRSCPAPDAGHWWWMPVAGCSFTVLLGMNGFRTQTRSMSDEEKKMSFEIWCDLLEVELKRALEDFRDPGIGQSTGEKQKPYAESSLKQCSTLFPRNSGQSQIMI